MNVGYPQDSADRKQKDALMQQKIKQIAQTNMVDILKKLPTEFLKGVYMKKDVLEYIFKNGQNSQLVNFLQNNF
ncbi:hypothetical protein EGT49_10265 [Companilactobacillus suantsaicola]|uniref:Uncharacterized protein n=2 Tax=Companilactobacillus suantsaicola TaxID=2487723 RepID=A0A4Z0JHV2_9LACO|nr:hypothetical protein EGT49_10265 [Companilactobacillus suantsaicola]